MARVTVESREADSAAATVGAVVRLKNMSVLEWK